MNKMFMRRCFSSFLPSQKSFLFGQKIVSRPTVFNRGFSRVNVRHLEIAEDRSAKFRRKRPTVSKILQKLFSLIYSLIKVDSMNLLNSIF